MTHLFKQLIKKIFNRFLPQDPYEEWYKRVKRADELNAEERRVWDEEQAQMWRDYYEGLL